MQLGDRIVRNLWPRLKLLFAKPVGFYIKGLAVLGLELLVTGFSLSLGALLIGTDFAAAENKRKYFFTYWRQNDVSPLWLLLTALFLVFISRLINYLKTAKSQESEQYDRMLPRLIGGAIEETFRIPPRTEEKMGPLLQRFEKAVIAILEGDAVGAEISANVMRYVPKHPDAPEAGLALERWGTRPPDRDDICLRLLPSLPGAPEAFLKREPVYIADTQSPKYKGAFHGKKYRSILSIPVFKLDPQKTCCGIINIDSTMTDQFKSKEFIDEHILPRIDPLLKLTAAIWEKAYGEGDRG